MVHQEMQSGKRISTSNVEDPERERQLFWRKTFPPIPKPASAKNTEKTRGPSAGKSLSKEPNESASAMQGNGMQPLRPI